MTWSKPARPDWMERATYDDLPGTMEVRVVRVHVDRRGFRTRSLDLVTTLLDAEVYTKKDLASLYRRRWDAELHLRSIKVVLELDVLRCKTPELVRKEIWMGLLGYNVIRAVMAEAALAHGRMPHRVSFKGRSRPCWRTPRPCARGRRGSAAGCGGSCWRRSPTTRWGTARTGWNLGLESDGPSHTPY